MHFFIIICVFFLLPCTDVHAGAVVARQQQMKVQQEQAGAQRQQAEVQAYQQALAERQLAEQQAYQQALAQRQQAEAQAYQQASAEYQAAQIQAAQQQIMEYAVQAQIQAQVAAYIEQAQMAQAQQAIFKQAVEQQLAQRLAQNIAQGYADKVQNNMITEAINQVAQQRNAQQGINVQGQVNNSQAIDPSPRKNVRPEVMYPNQAVLVSGPRRGSTNGNSSQSVTAQGNNVEQVVDIVDISQVWKRLENNSKVWTLLIDAQIKAMIVTEHIQRFTKQGVRIKKDAGFYVQLIDEISNQNPRLLLNPFKDLLQMVTVMEYDFDAGVDQEALARKVLGDQMYEVNRRRLKR